MAVESDGYLRTALTFFAETAADCLSVKYRTFYVREWMEVLLERDDRVRPLKPKHPSKKRLAISPSRDEPTKRVKQVYTCTDD